MKSARVSAVEDDQVYLEWFPENDLSLDHTHGVKAIIAPSRRHPLVLKDHQLVCDDILSAATTSRLFPMYNSWRPLDLRQLATIHNIGSSRRDNREVLLERLVQHRCNNQCGHAVVVFTTLARL